MTPGIKNKIIDKAQKIGFQKVGFAKADFYKEDKKNLYSWIDNGYNASMQWIDKRKEERSNCWTWKENHLLLLLFQMVRGFQVADPLQAVQEN